MRATFDTAVTRTSALVLVLAMTLSCTRQQATEPRAEPASAVQPRADVQRTQAALVGPTGTEQDLLGQKEIPADAYYGVQTARALEIIRERKVLTEAQIADLLDPVKLTNLDKSQYRARERATAKR